MALNVEAFYDAINNIARRQVQASPSDLTIDAKIVYISDITVGKYKVEYEGNTFTAFSTNPDVTYTVGERAYVLVPQGDFSAKKVILGRSAYNNNLTHADIQDMTNFYVDQGPNWVDKTQGTYDLTRGMVEDDWTFEDDERNDNRLQICVVDEKDKDKLTHPPANYADIGFRRFTVDRQEEIDNPKNRFPRSYMTDKELQVVDTSFTNYAKRYSWLKIQADFLTQFNSVHNSGEYQLKITFIADNPKYAEEGTEKYSKNGEQPQYILVDFYLGFKQFNGSVYAQVVPTPQKGYYAVNPGELKGLYSVSLEQDGKFVCDYTQHYDEQTGDLQWLPENQVLDTNNVIVSNIDIRFCKKINLLETLYYVWIEQPLGDSVYDPDELGNSGRDSVTLIPHMAYGQQEVSKDCRFIWFREDLSIPNEHEPNKDDRDEDGKTYYDYGGPGWRPITHFIEDDHDGFKLNEDGSLRVYKSEVPWQWRFKLVGIYSTDDKNTYGEDIAFVKNRDSKYDLYIQPFTDKGSNTKMLRINDKNRVVAEQVNPDTKRPYPEWFGDWYYQLSDNSYNEIIPQYYHGPLGISEFSSYEHILFRVAAYDPAQVAPDTGEWQEGEPRTLVAPVGILSYEVNVSTDLDLLIEWEGQSSFNYTALGQAYTSVSEKEYQLAPKINWVHGESLAYDVQIFAPDGAPLGTRSFYNPEDQSESVYKASGQGYDPPGSMMYAMYQDANNVLHFKVKQEYDPDCILNTINVEVHTIQDDKWYEKPLEVIFTKDGQQGTQGTGWCAPLRLTNHDGLRKPVWDRKQQKYEIKEVAEAFTTPLGMPTMPLILKKQGSNYVQVDKTKVVIRPFVTKDGKKLESLVESGSDSSHYRIKAYYDVRFPQNAKDSNVANSSFLRICDPISGEKLSDYGSAGRPKTNPDGEAGLFAMTLWDGSDKTAPQNNLYNAVQIRYETRAGLGLTHDQICNQFIVHCQVDIETDLPTTVRRKTGAQITDYEIGSGQGWHRIKSISSWYPIDVFIEEPDSEVDFDPHFVSINWPQSIAYDSRGYSPVIDCDYLEFYYGYFPDAGDKDAARFIVPEVPLVNQPVQTVEYNPNPILDNVTDEADLREVETNDENRTWSDMEEQMRAEALYKTLVSRIPEFIYKLKPKSHLNWQEGTVGALFGYFDGSDEKGIKLPKGTFIRNQIYYLNAYENVDINSWDGQGIDINEDNGTIFAPTIGAGFKGPLTNTFTGVLMGVNVGFRRETGGITQYTDIASRELEEYPYMTGLFGYQCGYSSFGLLENGTAFFGRKDRGGRIIIDGYNATIYGGANGELTSPAIGDPMWNSMRLTMVDLSHSTSSYKGEENNEGIIENPDDGDSTLEGRSSRDGGNIIGDNEAVTTEVQGVKQGFDGAFFGSGTIMRDDYGVINQLPVWYKDIWEYAYIKANSAAPWWLTNPKLAYYENVDTILDEYEGQSYESMVSSGDNYRINYWYPDLEKIRQGYSQISAAGEESGCLNITGFGPCRASTTPAIEIGQHPTGLMPGLLPWGSTEKVFRSLWIPGDRNFMVTYDGTLWAMNGVFMGNVIGSNIIGGRIQGVAMGIGNPQDIDWSTVQKIDSMCDWAHLMAPVSRNLTQDEQDAAYGAFSVDPDGNVICKNILIYGGSIDLGTFHIVGTEGGANDQYGGKVAGALIQFGESDFVGPVHCYGNLGIGPGLNGDLVQVAPGFPPGFQMSKQGNLFQTNGLVALGIVLPGKAAKNTSMHEKFSGKDTPDWMDIGELKYIAQNVTPGQPGIGEKTDTIEEMAFFSIDSRFDDMLKPDAPTSGTDVAGYQGHMWPMTFKYIDAKTKTEETGDEPTEYAGVHAYLTTMDLFKSKTMKISTGTSTGTGDNKDSNETVPVGSNYFRVGPWGQEGFRYYICQEWQDESKSEQPTVTRGDQTVRGYMGLVNRYGYGDGQSVSLAIGMTSWGSAPIIFMSDENYAVRVRQSSFLEGSNVATAKEKLDFKKTNVHEGGYRSVIFFGGGDSEASHISLMNVVTASSNANSGYLSMEASKDESATSSALGLKNEKAICGIILDPEKYGSGALTQRKGAYLYGKDDTEVHIVAGDTSKHLDHTNTTGDADLGYSEVWLSKTCVRLAADEAWSLCLGNNAHAAYWGSHRIGMDKTSSMYCHPNSISIWVDATPGENWSTSKPGVSFNKNGVYFGDGEGHILGKGGHIYFQDAWADENNQHNIYARFA